MVDVRDDVTVVVEIVVTANGDVDAISLENDSSISSKSFCDRLQASRLLS